MAHAPQHNAIRNPQSPTLSNPCIWVFGPGPEGRLCGECGNLTAHYLVQGREPRREEEAPTSPPAAGPARRTIYTCAKSSLPRFVTAPACSRFVEPATRFQPTPNPRPLAPGAD